VVQNNTMADLAAEIQDSLSRSGKGGMSVAFKNADGTVGAPGITFSAETTSGMYRNAAGDLRISVLGTWRFAVSGSGIATNGPVTIVDATGTHAASIAAPIGLAVDYMVTMPSGLPAGNYPVSLAPSGVLSAAQLTNAGQNFGTPANPTDVVILSYLGNTSTAVTGVNANLGRAPGVTKSNATGKAWFTQDTNGSPAVSGAIAGCGAGGSNAGAGVLFSIPTGFRFYSDNASHSTTLPIIWYDASVSYLRQGALVAFSNTGTICFWAVDSAGAALSLDAGDFLYVDCCTWTASV
jgi:hypothetical protein